MCAVADSKSGNANESAKGYTEISVRIPRDIEEPFTDFLIDNITGGNGLVLEDLDDDVLIRFYLSSTTDVESERGKLRDYIADKTSLDCADIDDRLQSKPIREIDWANEYRRKFEPVEIGDVVVKSVWSTDEFPDKMVIAIEPKMAFGTGKHETTKLCIDAVMRNIKAGDTVLDLGTGSGILSIVAAKLGAVDILGIDIDAASIDNANDNIGHNDVSEIITVKQGSMELVEQSSHFDVVVSNLIRDGIFELFDDFVRAAKPGGMLILSGILTNQIEEMNDFFKTKGYPTFDITTMNEWACYEMRV